MFPDGGIAPKHADLIQQRVLQNKTTQLNTQETLRAQLEGAQGFGSKEPSIEDLLNLKAQLESGADINESQLEGTQGFGSEESSIEDLLKLKAQLENGAEISKAQLEGAQGFDPKESSIEDLLKLKAQLESGAEINTTQIEGAQGFGSEESSIEGLLKLKAQLESGAEISKAQLEGTQGFGSEESGIEDLLKLKAQLESGAEISKAQLGGPQGFGSEKSSIEDLLKLKAQLAVDILEGTQNTLQVDTDEMHKLLDDYANLQADTAEMHKLQQLVNEELQKFIKEENKPNVEIFAGNKLISIKGQNEAQLLMTLRPHLIAKARIWSRNSITGEIKEHKFTSAPKEVWEKAIEHAIANYNQKMMVSSHLTPSKTSGSKSTEPLGGEHHVQSSPTPVLTRQASGKTQKTVNVDDTKIRKTERNNLIAAALKDAILKLDRINEEEKASEIKQEKREKHIKKDEIKEDNLNAELRQGEIKNEDLKKLVEDARTILQQVQMPVTREIILPQLKEIRDIIQILENDPRSSGPESKSNQVRDVYLTLVKFVVTVKKELKAAVGSNTVVSPGKASTVFDKGS